MLGGTTRVSATPAALSWRHPLETASQSEAGFERLYQGLALLLTWPVTGAAAELTTALTVHER